ncbi:hypothetical protein CR513_14635, partial [Mucuna pruriens]
MTYTKLFPLLLEQKLIEVVPLKPIELPYPRSYKPNNRCDYHGGAIGHATERCWSLKHKVQDLLDNGLLGFEDKEPNVHNNHLPAHGTMAVNAIDHEDKRIASPSGESKEAPKKAVTEEEAQAFLKVIQYSEYEMLDQLHKTPARISLLSLLINSKSHRELLLKTLNDAHVPQDITPTKFGGIINNITTSRHQSYSKEEVPTEGKTHNQPLHIVVKCENYMITRVLIDNRSSLNVMPKTTLDKLYALGAILKNSPIVVRALDGSKRQVMDIQPAYNCLLGRPWIHAAGAVLFIPASKGQILSRLTTDQGYGGERNDGQHAYSHRVCGR